MTSLPQIRGHSRRRPNRTCAVSGLGMRIPRELPMRVSRGQGGPAPEWKAESSIWTPETEN